MSSRACAVSVSWVKGHAKDIDVERGRTTREDKIGNDGADKLAVAGAASHHVSAEVVADAQARRETARRTHEMMVASVVVERLLQEDLLKEDEPDRGSDVGSGVCIDDDRCMELTISDDVEPEPEGCDDNDVYARGGCR